MKIDQKKIRAFVFPYDNCDVDELLNQLQSHGFILRYEVNGNKYIQVINFKKHQKPHPKEAASIKCILKVLCVAVKKAVKMVGH